MNLLKLALKNIYGNGFRSGVVALCALLIAAFALFTTILMRGAENSLNLALERLGADIIVVPEGAGSKVEGAILMGEPARFWMAGDVAARVAAVPTVERVSPQLYLATLTGASCCSVGDMFMIAFDPASDFTVQPWLEKKMGGSLRLGEVVGGSYISATEGDQNIKLYGYLVTLKSNLEPTGTGLDQTLFLTFDTARDIAAKSVSQAESPLSIPEGSISAVMVKVKSGSNLHAAAAQIIQTVPGVTVIESTDMFQAYRKQMTGLLRTILVIMSITWALSVILIGLIFSMAANERRKEMGVLRALGAPRKFLFQSLLAEASLLALYGGVTGLAVAGLAIFLFRKLIVATLGFPFLLPSPGAFFVLVGGGLALALLSVNLAALAPAFRISRMDPSIAMRE